MTICPYDAGLTEDFGFNLGAPGCYNKKSNETCVLEKIKVKSRYGEEIDGYRAPCGLIFDKYFKLVDLK